MKIREREGKFMATKSQPQIQAQQQQRNRTGKNNSMRRSQSSNSEYSHMDSPHSPLKFHSPLRSDLGDPPESPPYVSPDTSPPASPEKTIDYSKAIVAVDKCTQYTPSRSPFPTENGKAAENVPPVAVFGRAVRDEPLRVATKVGPAAATEGGDGGRSRSVASGRRRTGKEVALSRAALGFRVTEVILCVISFSVMAADKTQGWSGDSFDRYREYRYCLSVNVIGFVYSGFDIAYHLISGKHAIGRNLHHYFDFFMDQILAYLLISAASAAATRVDDWQSNWGKDKFTEMASASVATAFLAFVAFSISSLISGYNLSTLD